MVSNSKESPSSMMCLYIILCHAYMHCWKDSSWIPLSSVVRAHWMSSAPLKRVPLMITLSCVRHSREMGGVFHYGYDRPGQEMSDVQGFVSRCIVVGEADTIWPATTLVSSRVPREANIAGSRCRLADWLSASVARAYYWRCLSHRRTWSPLLFRHTSETRIYNNLSNLLGTKLKQNKDSK